CIAEVKGGGRVDHEIETAGAELLGEEPAGGQEQAGGGREVARACSVRKDREALTDVGDEAPDGGDLQDPVEVGRPRDLELIEGARRRAADLDGQRAAGRLRVVAGDG